jgi:hypothetical protein
MTNELQCRFGQGHLHFLIISCFQRIPPQRSDRARSIFVKILGWALRPGGNL